MKTKWVSDADIAEYVLHCAGDDASDRWLDNDAWTVREPTNEQIITDSNAWLQKEGLSVVVLDINLDNQDDGPDGILWEVSCSDAKKIKAEAD